MASEGTATASPGSMKTGRPAIETTLRPSTFPKAQKEDALLYTGESKKNWYTHTFNMVHIRKCCKTINEAERLIKELERDGVVTIIDPKPPRNQVPGKDSQPSIKAYVMATEDGCNQIDLLKRLR